MSREGWWGAALAAVRAAVMRDDAEESWEEGDDDEEDDPPPARAPAAEALAWRDVTKAVGTPVRTGAACLRLPQY